MKPQILALALALVTSFACDSKPADAKKEDAKSADAKKDGKAADVKADAKPADAKPADAKPADAKPADAGATLPTETETLALDQGTSKIPATVDVPKGSTTFNDDETTIRVDFGEGRDNGKLFGIQIAKGNEFNTNLGDLEAMMLKNEYGSTNKILEKTDTLLRYTMQSEGGSLNHNFQMIIDVGGEKWICKQGNYGGFSEEASKRQIEACKTLKAK